MNTDNENKIKEIAENIEKYLEENSYNDLARLIVKNIPKSYCNRLFRKHNKENIVMCEYCEGRLQNRKRLLEDKNNTGTEVYIDECNDLTLQIPTLDIVDDYFEIKLNYCPICGRKLTETINKER